MMIDKFLPNGQKKPRAKVDVFLKRKGHVTCRVTERFPNCSPFPPPSASYLHPPFAAAKSSFLVPFTPTLWRPLSMPGGTGAPVPNANKLCSFPPPPGGGGQ